MFRTKSSSFCISSVENTYHLLACFTGKGNGMLEVRWEQKLRMAIMFFTDFQKQPHHQVKPFQAHMFSDMTLELDMKTYKQLRQNSAPNSWESAWVMWRWTDLFHHYYFVLKTSGIEFGKKDTSCSCKQQVFLKTGPSPTLKIDTWNHVKISSIGKHTTIWLDGVKVVDMDDPSYSSTASIYRTIQRRCFNCLRQGDCNTPVTNQRYSD